MAAAPWTTLCFHIALISVACVPAVLARTCLRLQTAQPCQWGGFQQLSRAPHPLPPLCRAAVATAVKPKSSGVSTPVLVVLAAAVAGFFWWKRRAAAGGAKPAERKGSRSQFKFPSGQVSGERGERSCIAHCE